MLLHSYAVAKLAVNFTVNTISNGAANLTGLKWNFLGGENFQHNQHQY